MSLDLEEEDFLANPGDDLDVLPSMDRHMADDGILHLMGNNLRESRSPPPRVLDFLHAVIRHWLGSAVRFNHTTSVPDLRSLPRISWEAVMETLCMIIAKGNTQKTLDWMDGAVCLLLSRSRYPLPLDSTSIRTILNDDKYLCAILDSAKRAPVDPEAVIKLLFVVIKHREQPWASNDRLLTPRLPLETKTFSGDVLQRICSVLADALHYHLPHGSGRSQPSWVYDAALLLFSDFPHLNDPSDMSSAIRSWLSSVELRSDNASTADAACQAGRALAECILPEGGQSFHSLSLRLFLPMEDTRASSPESSYLLNVLSFYSSLLLRTLRALGLNAQDSPTLLWSVLHRNPELFNIASARPILDDIWRFLSLLVGRYLNSVTPSCAVGFEDVFRATLELGLKHPPAKESAQELWRAGAQNKHCLVKFHLTFLAAIRRRARLAGPDPAMRELAGPTGRYSSKIFRKYATDLPHRSLAMYSD